MLQGALLVLAAARICEHHELPHDLFAVVSGRFVWAKGVLSLLLSLLSLLVQKYKH
jgi:hypothetical protein